MKEAPFVSMPSLVEAMAEAIEPFLNTPFAFFGHSMGALIAFESARYLKNKLGVAPQILFVSGRRAPQVPDPSAIAYNLPKEELIEELFRLEGTPKEVLENTELMEIMLPIIRADFQIVQTYEYVDGKPLQCPITAFCGLQDHEENRYLTVQWKSQTISRFALHLLPGGHFFIRSAKAQLLEMITRELHALNFSGKTSS